MIKNNIELKDRIVKKALELGACAAGIADVQVLKKSPSHRIKPKAASKITREY